MTASDSSHEAVQAHAARTIGRIAARFAALADEADRQGRGDELVADFIRAVAEDAAAAAVLEHGNRVAALAAATDPAERKRLSEHVEILRPLAGVDFADMMGRCSRDVDEAAQRLIEDIALRAFDARFVELVASVREAGRA